MIEKLAPYWRHCGFGRAKGPELKIIQKVVGMFESFKNLLRGAPKVKVAVRSSTNNADAEAPWASFDVDPELAYHCRDQGAAQTPSSDSSVLPEPTVPGPHLVESVSAPELLAPEIGIIGVEYSEVLVPPTQMIDSNGASVTISSEMVTLQEVAVPAPLPVSATKPRKACSPRTPGVRVAKASKRRQMDECIQKIQLELAASAQELAQIFK